MTYASFEQSSEAGTPTEIYEITAGTIDTFYFTSAAESVTIESNTYLPIEGLDRSKDTKGVSKRDNNFTIQLPTSNPVAQLYTGNLPGFRVRLKVRRFHLTDPALEVVLVFDGFIQSASFVKRSKVAVLTARPTLSALGRQVPRRTYQSTCNHVLYDTLTCRVDKTLPANFVNGVRVASVVGSVMTLIGLDDEFSDGFATAGFVELTDGSEGRTILLHSENTLTLMSPFTDPPIEVNVFAGCDHLFTTCISKFDNGINFGGFPFIPILNPYDTGLE